MLIDSHCHLDLAVFDGQRDELMVRCAEQGVSGFLVPATRFESWGKINHLVKRYPTWRVAYGLHPYFLREATLEQIDRLAEQCDTERVMAVGEIGLDCWPGAVDMDIQWEYLLRQLSVAKLLRLPVILHARKSYDLVLKCLRQVGFDRGGIVHAFNGSLEQAKRFTGLGFVLGIGGTVTYSRAKKAHRVLASLDVKDYVLETDSPDMPISGFQGQTNTPLSLPCIVQHIANIREESVDQVTRQAYENLLSVFPKWNEDLL